MTPHTRRAGGLVLAAVALFALGACRDKPESAGDAAAVVGPSAPPSGVPTPRGTPSTAPLDPATDFVSQQLRLRAAALGRTLRAAGPPTRGTLATGAEASHDFSVVAGHCYRIVAVGGVDVNDLDMSLFAPDGSEIDNDPPGDSYPTLGGTRPFCPPTGGYYRVRVRMASGQGEYGLQVFGTP